MILIDIEPMYKGEVSMLEHHLELAKNIDPADLQHTTMILTKSEFAAYAMAHMERVQSERRVRKRPMPKYWTDLMMHCHKCGNAFRQATMHQRVADGKHCWFCDVCWDGRPKRRNG